MAISISNFDDYFLQFQAKKLKIKYNLVDCIDHSPLNLVLILPN